MAAILLLGAKVPFTSGGQEALLRSLGAALRERGHLVDTVELPFALPEKESLLYQASLWRGLDLERFAGTEVDLVIATKFPSYFAAHPKKSVWLVHQHRPLYDLYGGPYSDFSDDPRDETIRRMVADADTAVLKESAYVAGISRNVVSRLAKFNRIDAECLYPPLPLGDRYFNGASEPYILSVGRICGIKRIDLLVKALPMVHEGITLKIVGQPDEPGIMDYLQNEILKHHLSHRVTFLGRVDEQQLLDLYAHAMVVYYAPHNEDYGYVTLEALASGKPVLAGTDSGGVLEFIEDGVTGSVVAPTLDEIAHGLNRLIESPERCQTMGEAGRALVETLGLTRGWDHIVSRLLSPLTADPLAGNRDTSLNEEVLPTAELKEVGGASR